ncbi:hypothetical protein [Noviherbaspirillum saxi]|uniref:Carbohydrate binding domain-containing protein n=1 Tax=Noviherbaspirillum saxi TaxID=2320863 RepID=A0A3A3FTZ7_9BURK|nr:hypothetical protein [Noviherbaspirillum saxi]RJF99010.1 hypothetical protein D3871_11195 [Noviherbaspirillum saxi]
MSDGFTIIPAIAITDDILVSSNVAENDYPVYSTATTYAVDAYVISTTTHHIYRSLQGANTNKPLPVLPATATDWWQDVGATNRHKMFDRSVQSQTSNPNSIEIELAIEGRATAVTILNADGDELHIEMESPTAGVVYDQTFSLLDHAGISDFYSWHFDDRDRIRDLAITGLPPYAGVTLRISILRPGGTALCGACLVGQAKEIGDTQFGARIGMTDYSAKTPDAFGNLTVLERAYSQRGSFTVVVQNTFIDRLHKLLARYRATPVVYIGSPLYGCMVNYGFYKDYETEIQYTTESLLSINIESLT